MATMQQLTGTSPTPQASSAVTQLSGVGSANYRSGESLANDLMKIMGEGAKTAQTYYTASKEAAKRVAMDKSTELAKFISNVKGTINYDDPASLAEAQKEIALKQAELSNVKFELEDAQEAFDSVYVAPTAREVASINAQLKTRELVKLDDINFESLKRDADERYNNGIYLTKDEIDASVSSMTAYKRYKKEDAEYVIADRNTTAFDTKIKQGLGAMLTANGYNAEEGYTGKVAKNIFNREFGAWGTMDDKGNIKWADGIENKAKEEILRSWTAFNSNMTKGKKPYNELYYLTAKSANDLNGNASSNYVPSSEINQNIDTVDKNFMKANDNIPLTDEQVKGVKVAIGELKNTYDETRIVEEGLNSSNLQTLLKDGKTVKLYDNLTGGKRTIKIPASKYKAAVKYYLEKDSKAALAIDPTTAENEKVFTAAVARIKKIESASGMQSSLTMKYGDAAKSGSYTTFKGVSRRQLTAYNKVVISNEKNNEALTILNDELTQIENNRNLTETQKDMTVNAALQAKRQKDTEYKNSAFAKNAVHAYMNKEREGEGLFTLSSNVTVGTEQAVLEYIIHTNMTSDPEAAMDKLTFVDFGSNVPSWMPITGNKDYRVVLPTGLRSEKDLYKAVDVTIADYNKRFKTDYDDADIVVENGFKNGDFTIVLRTRDENRFIGELEYKKDIRTYSLTSKGE